MWFAGWGSGSYEAFCFGWKSFLASLQKSVQRLSSWIRGAVFCNAFAFRLPRRWMGTWKVDGSFFLKSSLKTGDDPANTNFRRAGGTGEFSREGFELKLFEGSQVF